MSTDDWGERWGVFFTPRHGARRTLLLGTTGTEKAGWKLVLDLRYEHRNGDWSVRRVPAPAAPARPH